VSGPQAIYGEFGGPDGPDGGGEGPPGSRPVDLGGQVLRFVPRVGGGWDVDRIQQAN